MSNFRTGDKVKVITEDQGHYFTIGTEGEVTGIEWSKAELAYVITVEANDLKQLLLESDIELIKTK